MIRDFGNLDQGLTERYRRLQRSENGTSTQIMGGGGYNKGRILCLGHKESDARIVRQDRRYW